MHVTTDEHDGFQPFSTILRRILYRAAAISEINDTECPFEREGRIQFALGCGDIDFFTARALRGGEDA